MKDSPLILVSNDDGITARGICALTEAMRGLGRVVVVAPDRQMSAVSQSITLHRPLRIKKISEDSYTVDGTPTDCVVLAIHEILGRKPDLVVSGINHGPNLGEDVHYSGTVSAAYEGGLKGIPSFAISLVSSECKHFDTAAMFATRLAKKLLVSGLPKGIILNVNVPDLAPDKVGDFVIARQGKRDYGSVIVSKEDPRGKRYYWIGGDDTGFVSIEGSDCNAVNEGKIAITPLKIDITDDESLSMLSELSI